MTPSTTAELSKAEILDRAQTLSDAFRARATETETLGKLPDDLWEQVKDSGLLSLLVPKHLGGLDAGPRAMVDVVRILCRGDASAAWVTSFAIQGQEGFSSLPRELWDKLSKGRPFVLTAGSVTQRKPAIAEPVDGGYILSAHVGYASGCLHADWVFVIALVAGQEDLGPRRFIVPVEQVTILDNWAPSGMRGTGSNDVVIDRVFVPSELAVDDRLNSAPTGSRSIGSRSVIIGDTDTLKYPTHRVIMLMHAALLVGAGEAILELFPPYLEKRFRPFSTVAPRDSGVSHKTYGAAAYDVANARLLLEHATETIIEAFGSGRGFTLEEQARAAIVTAGIINSIRETSSALIRLAGSSVHQAGSALDRFWRDIEVMSSHPSGDWDAVAETAGRVLLGKGPGPHNPLFL